MGIRISEMEAAAQMSAEDIVPIVTNGDNKTLTGAQIKQYTAGDKQDSLLGGNVSAGNLNDYFTAGFYYINSTSVSNIPTNSNGILEVIAKQSGAALCIQRYSAIESNKITGIYERNYSSGAWRAWTQVSLVNAPTLETFDNVAVASGTHTTIGSITPAAGTYLITAGVAFPNNDTGIRRILLSRSNNSTSTPALVDTSPVLIQTQAQAAAVSSSYSQAVQLTTIATINATYPSIYLRAYQNSGSELTVNGAIQYMRIM